MKKFFEDTEVIGIVFDEPSNAGEINEAPIMRGGEDISDRPRRAKREAKAMEVLNKFKKLANIKQSVSLDNIETDGKRITLKIYAPSEKLNLDLDELEQKMGAGISLSGEHDDATYISIRLSKSITESKDPIHKSLKEANPGLMKKKRFEGSKEKEEPEVCDTCKGKGEIQDPGAPKHRRGITVPCPNCSKEDVRDIDLKSKKKKAEAGLNEAVDASGIKQDKEIGELCNDIKSSIEQPYYEKLSVTEKREIKKLLLKAFEDISKHSLKHWSDR